MYHDAPPPLRITVLERARAFGRLWLERHLHLFSDRHQKPGGWSELYVHRAEVDAWLSGRLDSLRTESPTGTGLDALAESEASLRAKFAEQADSQPGPVEALAAAFSVSDSLHLVEVEPEFARALGHAWCDFTKKTADVGFLIELLARDAAEQVRLMAFFSRADHPLFRLRVLELDATVPGAPGAVRALVQRPVRLCDRVVEWLLEQERFLIESGFPAASTEEPPTRALPARAPWRLDTRERPLESILIPDDARANVAAVFRRTFTPGGTAARLLIHGPTGSGRRSLAIAGASGIGRPLLIAQARDVPTSGTDAWFTALLREVRLQGAVPLITDVETLDGEAGRLHALAAALDGHPGPVLFTGQARTGTLAAAFSGLADLRMPHPTADQQRVLWERSLPPDLAFPPGFAIADIVARYSLTGGAIESIVAAALPLIGRRARTAKPGASRLLTPQVLLPILREHLGHRLGAIANPVVRGFAWDDLVVPDKTAAGLRELVSFVRNRDKIVNAWGFGQKLAYGRGVAALFHGPPGTGKTMAASIIGTELAMEIFQIDLSRVVDKYIGETEKNLGRVFDEGARAQAILLFDEADSLFGKRTNVQTSVDRYANLEVNFLLQRVESYEGICILTSNNPDHIDEAFKRRIRFKVEFPFPLMEERERLWKTMMPAEAPLGTDVDYGWLGEKFEVSGAHIKSIILRGAAMAAEEGTLITMDVLLRAGNREYTEMGKLVRT